MHTKIPFIYKAYYYIRLDLRLEGKELYLMYFYTFKWNYLVFGMDFGI